MEEYQVTSEGVSRKLPEPFFVIATQNPFHQIGTYPLPESQLDRFLVRISLGYPEEEVERLLFKGQETRSQIAELKPVLSTKQLLDFQTQVENITVTDTLLDYLQLLVKGSRTSSFWSHGLSPRGGLSLLKAAKAWAFLHARDYVIPDDIQAVWTSVAAHRLLTQAGTEPAQNSPVLNLLRDTPIPR